VAVDTSKHLNGDAELINMNGPCFFLMLLSLTELNTYRYTEIVRGWDNYTG